MIIRLGTGVGLFYSSGPKKKYRNADQVVLATFRPTGTKLALNCGNLTTFGLLCHTI